MTPEEKRFNNDLRLSFLALTIILILLNFVLFLTPAKFFLDDYFAYYEIYSKLLFSSTGKDPLFAFYTFILNAIFGSSDFGYLIYRQFTVIVFIYLLYLSSKSCARLVYNESKNFKYSFLNRLWLILIFISFAPSAANSALVIIRSGLSAAVFIFVATNIPIICTKYKLPIINTYAALAIFPILIHSSSGFISLYLVLITWIFSSLPQFRLGRIVLINKVIRLIPYTLITLLFVYLFLQQAQTRLDFLHSVLHPARLASYSSLLALGGIFAFNEKKLTKSIKSTFIFYPIIITPAIIYLIYFSMYVLGNSLVQGSGDAMVRLYSQFAIFLFPLLIVPWEYRLAKLFTFLSFTAISTFAINGYFGSLWLK